jgi:hypothetical protein
VHTSSPDASSPDAATDTDASSPFTTACLDNQSADDCCHKYRAACEAAGGSLEFCNSPSCTNGPPWNGPMPGQCQPPPAPAPGKFACAALSCSVGEVCVYAHPQADGCSSHTCMSLCAGTPTCACAQSALGQPNISCTTDANGNLFVSFYD